VTRVVLTQPLPRIERLAQRLAERGHEIAPCPLRRLRSLAADPRVAATLGSIAERDWVVFVSPGAIEVALRDRGPAPWPGATGIALIGPGSEDALAEYGIAASQVRILRPARAPYDADALMRLAPFDSPQGLRVLVLAGNAGRTDWIDALRERGASVQRVAIYRSEALVPGADVLARLRRWSRQAAAVVFVFTTLDAVRELEAALARARLRGWARRQRALVPHPRIAATLAALGWRTVETIEPGERALIAALESA